MADDISMGKWQPIETAPNDKSVLVTDGKFCFVAKRFNLSSRRRDPYWCWYVTIGNEVASSGDDGPSSMLEDHAFGSHPTHWMPLPALPITLGM